MSYLKDKTDPKLVNQKQAFGVIDEIVYYGIKNKFNTDKVNFTWTNTEQWYKMVKQTLIDSNRQLKFPSMAITRTAQEIDWQYPNQSINGNKYTIQKKLIQSRQRKSNVGRVYQPQVWQITICDTPIFVKCKYNLSVVTNMQEDYNDLIQDVLSLFEGGRTYLVKEQEVQLRQRKLMNRYGVHAVITGQKFQILNGIEQGNRIFTKDFQITTNTYIYRNIQKTRTATKNVVTFKENV